MMCSPSRTRQPVTSGTATPRTDEVVSIAKGSITRHHVFHVTRIAPEQPEHLIEHQPLFGPVDENRMKRPVEIGLAGEAE